MKGLKKPELSYIKTLEPEGVEEFLKSVETISKKARCAERGIYGGGCPYPIEINFWSRLFSFL